MDIPIILKNIPVERFSAVSILLVEDDPLDAELTLLALNDIRLDDKVTVVKDGAEALDYLFSAGRYLDRKNQKLPDLILLDIIMPKVDGKEVLRRIRIDP